MQSTAGVRPRGRPARAAVYFSLVPPSEDELRVVLADDDHFFREGLRDLLVEDGLVVVGEAADGGRAVSLAGELTPHVLVIELNMPDGSSVEAIRRIVGAGTHVNVVVLTASADAHDVSEALAAGALGYLLKQTRTDEIAGAIRHVAAGLAVLSGDVMRAFAEQLPGDDRAREPATHDGAALTARELDVLRLIADGADNAAIGEALSISKHTVKQYVTNILEKLGLHSRVQAAVYAVRAGLV
jgi:DNA-binding NarL/FixJ family response regulator